MTYMAPSENYIVFSCNLRCLLIFLHGRSRTYRVASLRAVPVSRISYNLYFDCKHVRYVTCNFNKRIYYNRYDEVIDFRDWNHQKSYRGNPQVCPGDN